MQNIPRIPRKEKSIYKPTDIWTHEDDLLFCKYCPSKRDKAYLMVARDTGCRPSEIVNIKIKDLVVMQMEDRSHIAKITVNGKTGNRTVRIYYAYPFVKDWLSNGHPFSTVPDIPLFCGTGKKNTGRKISAHTIGKIFAIYKKPIFPKLLNDDPTISEEDKRKIRDLLKKPWNPHFRRHTATTEISKRLKDPVLINEYMGWSQQGNTRQRYQHYYDNDSVEAMLVADGLISPTSGKIKKDILKPKQCPNCDESNKPEAKFCVKCKFILSFDAYNERMQESDKMKKAVEDIQARQTAFETVLKRMVASDLDVDINDPEEQERIVHVMEKVLTNKWNLFSQ